MINKKNLCCICNRTKVKSIRGYPSFARVTSDCLPWKKGGKLGVCMSCGSVQKIIDQDFFDETRKIYDCYSVYHQGRGQEQRIFEQSRGHSYVRSHLLLSRVFEKHVLPSRGRLLDVGCGNGNLLRSFTQLYPKWTLAGLELNNLNRETVEKIEQVEAFYTGDVTEIADRFNIISMLHCLEHIIDPLAFLKKIREKLEKNGLLLINVPSYLHNPFDLMIADHCSHFAIEILKNLCSVSGYKVILAVHDYIPKELTLLAQKSEEVADDKNLETHLSSLDSVVRALDWLKMTKDEALKISRGGEFGIFGTSIAGVWLFNEIEGKVKFFVDEDLNRVGRSLFGRKIYHPKQVLRDWRVFIALPFPIAVQVSERMKSYDASFYLPPN